MRLRKILDHGLTFEVVEIGPSEAAELLKKNTTNRPELPSAQVRYVEDMIGGNWVLNGEPVILSRTGRLLDGQNRLRACISANTPFITVLISGVDDSAFDVMGAGAARTLGHVLSIMKEDNYNALAAALVLLWQLDRGALCETDMPTKRQALAVLEANPAIRGSVTKAGALKHLISVPMMALVHYVGSERLGAKEKADRFLSDVASGVGLAIDSPARLLRERMIMNRAGKQRLVRKQVAALAIVAWNRVYEGKGLRVLKAPETEGKEKITIPSFTGLVSRQTPARNVA